ncbi:cadherin-like protein 26 [Arapaima gigas]
MLLVPALLVFKSTAQPGDIYRRAKAFKNPDSWSSGWDSSHDVYRGNNCPALGEPPMTGTATLNIHLRDQNDNTPQLTTNKLDMCLTDGKSRIDIMAFRCPYGGHFHFELLDGAEGQWMLQPSLGMVPLTSLSSAKEKPIQIPGSVPSSSPQQLNFL